MSLLPVTPLVPQAKEPDVASCAPIFDDNFRVPELVLGRHFHQQFRLGFELGNGASCVVHEAERIATEPHGHSHDADVEDEDRRRYAVKVFPHKHLIEDSRVLKREVRHLLHLHHAWRHSNSNRGLEGAANMHVRQWHPHIIGVDSVFENDFEVHIVMELAGRELFERCVCPSFFCACCL